MASVGRSQILVWMGAVACLGQSLRSGRSVLPSTPHKLAAARSLDGIQASNQFRRNSLISKPLTTSSRSRALTTLNGAALGGIWEAYLATLSEYPLPTKMVTSGVLSASGDALAQAIEFNDNPKPYEFRRSLVMATIGLAFTAPLLHMWYGGLHHFFFEGLGREWLAAAGLSSKLPTTLALLAADQLLFSPIATVLFFMMNGIGTSLAAFDFNLMPRIRAVNETLRREYWTTMINNWKLWPAAQLLNFFFVPLQFQVLFSNFVGLIWTCYLSLAAYRRQPTGPTAAAATAI
ncbi:hypothetical protein AAMO2058_000853300 [Amorphochlora amoebiformis]